MFKNKFKNSINKIYLKKLAIKKYYIKIIVFFYLLTIII